MSCNAFFFFFSSRRRHTRSLCDWSSDVCSSDLPSIRRFAGICSQSGISCPLHYLGEALAFRRGAVGIFKCHTYHGKYRGRSVFCAERLFDIWLANIAASGFFQVHVKAVRENLPDLPCCFCNLPSPIVCLSRRKQNSVTHLARFDLLGGECFSFARDFSNRTRDYRGVVIELRDVLLFSNPAFNCCFQTASTQFCLACVVFLDSGRCDNNLLCDIWRA